LLRYRRSTISGYHTTRKVYGLVKSSLHPKEITIDDPGLLCSHCFISFIDTNQLSCACLSVYLSVITGWQPFDSNTILGTLDTVFLSCYSFGLVVVGGMFAQLLLIDRSPLFLQHPSIDLVCGNRIGAKVWPKGWQCHDINLTHLIWINIFGSAQLSELL
jgi:hypothetical protein